MAGRAAKIISVVGLVALVAGRANGQTLYAMGGGGAPGLAHASNVAVDMSGSGLTCAEIADLPHQVFAAVGASSGPMPVVCGGVDRTTYYTECYIYNAADDTWDTFPSLNVARAYATSHKLNDNEFWIVGGYEGKFRLNTTEIYVSATGQFEYGPGLPFGVDQHCMANVNETHYVLVGGRHEYDDMVSKGVWLYDMGNDVWTQLPDLQTERANAQCGFVDTGSDLQIMVAGGTKENGDVWITTELFSFNTMSWSFSNNLPHPIEGAGNIPWEGSFLYAGGMDGSGYIKDDIYQYDPIGAVFNERPEVLNRQGRAYHGAVVVDAPCTTA